jgi:hypothetical protein
MSKPDDIPQDVWDAANATLGAGTVGVHLISAKGAEHIARAILSERNRCARIAFCAYDRKTEICSKIVRKIRSGVMQ